MSIDPRDDLSLLFTAAAAAANEHVVQHIAEAGFGDLRVSHGYVFQHVVPGPVSIGELAARLGMTAQGASKATVELEGMGYLRRRPGEDARTRLVELTERGWAAVEAARAARAEVNAEIRALLGPDDADALLRTLRRTAEETGGLAALASRRLRPPR
jgi:DNA-binding MarR family transcriptional regulator